MNASSISPFRALPEIEVRSDPGLLQPFAQDPQDRLELSSAPALGLLPKPALQASPPTSFTQKAVHAYYLSPDEKSLSPAGKAIYAKLRAKYLDDVQMCPIGTPTVYFTGGLPGSGKSSVLDYLWKESKDFVLVDPDSIKKDIVEDLAMLNPALRSEMAADPQWGTSVHWPSSLMAKELMDEALGSGKDIVFDSSMSTPDQDKYRKFAADSRRNGYHVKGLICNVGVEKSIERAEKRAKKPVSLPLPDGDKLLLPGRMVQADYIRECQGRLQQNMGAYLAEGLFDGVNVFDNNQDGQMPRLVETYQRVATLDGHYTCQKNP